MASLFICMELFFISKTKGLFIWDELARLDGMARLGEMTFIPRPYGIFHLTSIKEFAMSLEKIMSLEKDCFDHVVFKREVFYF